MYEIEGSMEEGWSITHREFSDSPTMYYKMSEDNGEPCVLQRSAAGYEDLHISENLNTESIQEYLDDLNDKELKELFDKYDKNAKKQEEELPSTNG